MGNLLLAALTGVTGSFDQAVRGLGKVLAIRGQVLPATLSNVTLCAELADGTIIQGESNIPKSKSRIKKVFIKPQRCLPPAEALAAIQTADAVVLGPGSLYTSIIPNLLVKGIPEALSRSPAIKIYVCNVMTQPGETDDYPASEHIRAVIDHAGDFLDYVLLNTGQIPARLRARYLQDGAFPVLADLEEIEKLGVAAFGADMVVHQTDVVRHHPDNLSQAILRQILPVCAQQGRVHFLHGQQKHVPGREDSDVKMR